MESQIAAVPTPLRHDPGYAGPNDETQPAHLPSQGNQDTLHDSQDTADHLNANGQEVSCIDWSNRINRQ